MKLKYEKEIINLIENAIDLMKVKINKDNNENIVQNFINLYIEVKEKISNNSVTEKDLLTIINLTEMYMKTSSNFQQEFLYAMAYVEDKVKKQLL